MVLSDTGSVADADTLWLGEDDDLAGAFAKVVVIPWHDPAMEEGLFVGEVVEPVVRGVAFAVVDCVLCVLLVLLYFMCRVAMGARYSSKRGMRGAG